MIVVNANLLVQYYVRGTHTAVAEAVLSRDAQWIAPMLWRSEFRNALILLVRRRLVPLEDAVVVAHEAERLMAGHEHIVVAHRVLRLAADSGCSAYDCEYVALAEDLDVPLVTSDRQVVRAFPSVALTPERFLAA